MLQMEWSQPQVQGDLVSPRAGHAGITIDEDWYIVGGGDNRNGMYNYMFNVTTRCLCSYLISLVFEFPMDM